MIGHLQNKNIVVFFIVSVITFFAFFPILRVPGWIDDVYIINGLNSIFYSAPNNPVYRTFYGISNGLLFAQSFLNKFNVYSSVNVMAIFYGIFLLIDFIQEHFKFRSTFVRIGMFVLVFLTFFVDILYLNTFTSTSIILFILVFLKLLNRPKNFFYLLVLVLSFLVRPELALFTFPMILVLLVCGPIRRLKIGAAYTIFLGILFMFLIKTDPFLELNNKLEQDNIPDLFTGISMLDGNNYSGTIDLNNARHYAFFSWFYGDVKNTYTHETVAEIKPFSPFSKASILRAPQKLKYEYYKASYRYNKEYLPHRNWFIKAVIAMLILLVAAVYFYKIQTKKKLKWATLFLPFVFSTLITITMVLFKMEYRVFYSLYIATILILFTINKEVITKNFLKFLSVILLLLLPMRVAEYVTTTKHLSIEHQSKEAFRKEINGKFENKLILFDFLTSSLNSPGFSNKPFNDGKNIFLLYGEVFSNFDNNHLRYLEEICGSHEIVPFYNCLYQRKNEVVFVYTSKRVTMLEMYFKQVYDLDVRFKKIENGSNALNSINYSYLWESIDADYYIFDNSFEDYK